MQSRQLASGSPGLPPPSASSSVFNAQQGEPRQQQQNHPRASESSSSASLGLDGLSLIDRARALCTVADDVQRATIEASHRIAAIHGSPDRPKKKKAAAQTKPVKEPPDICARPPSDVPPPRGEGWRRLGGVSVVRGSNRISAPPQTRRALTRDVEVCVDGGRYVVVPADIEPGGGFCVSLDRDFDGETNMAAMLYVRKKGPLGSVGVENEGTAATGGEEDVEGEGEGEGEREGEPIALPTKGGSRPVPPLAPLPAIPAPFGSVGGTSAARANSSPSPFSAGMERELDMFVMSRPQDRDDGGSTAAVREAQRRARRRALLQRKLDIAAGDQRMNASEATKKVPTATEIQHFKASRRAALARVASQRQKELARIQKAECSADEERRQREAESAARVEELRSVAVARAGNVAAQKRHRDREVEMSRRAEARAKRERVAAVLAYDETKADEHERRMRKETFCRIQRGKRRRQLALQRQEDERMERMRLYVGGGRHDIVPVAPAATVQTARSFFSFSGSAPSVSETVGGSHKGPWTAASPTGAPGRRRQTWRVPEDDDDDDEEDEFGKPRGGEHLVREGGLALHGLPNAGWRNDDQTAGGQIKKTQQRQRAAAEVAQRKTLDRHILSQTSQTRGFVPAAQDVGGGGISTTLRADHNAATAAAATSAHSSPTLTSPSGGAGSAKSASGTSVGSGRICAANNNNGKKKRERIAATPVWKRPVVPLSKPYVPVPRRDDT